MSQSMNRLRALAINAAFGGAVLLVSLLTGEAVLRYFVQLPMERVLPEVRYAPHPVRRFTLAPNQKAFSYGAPAFIDSRGFRVNGTEPTDEESGPAVIALGDSFTFGLGVKNEDTWPAKLQGKLRSTAHQPVRVINAGTISYGVFQEMDLLKTTALTMEPRIVVHALYWNDFMNAAAPLPGDPSPVDSGGYFTWDQLSVPRSTASRLTSMATNSSALLFSVKQAARTFAKPASGASPYGTAYQRFLEVGLTETEFKPIEQFWVELKRLGAERHFGVFVVIMPVSDVVKRPNPQTHPYPEAMRRILTRLEIPYLDGFELWAGRQVLHQYFLPEAADAHLNAEGYRIVAESLSAMLMSDPHLRNKLESPASRHSLQ
jgi:lysophospholipase L1-like esterase